MAAKIEENFGVETELIKSGGGIYDIKVDESLVYSRQANDNQFPESEESVIEAIREMSSGKS